jgi:hypothetical protein
MFRIFASLQFTQNESRSTSIPACADQCTGEFEPAQPFKPGQLVARVRHCA